MMAAIGRYSRANIESTGGMFAPGGTGEWGFVSITELASRVNGMGTEIKWEMGDHRGRGVQRWTGRDAKVVSD